MNADQRHIGQRIYIEPHREKTCHHFPTSSDKNPPVQAQNTIKGAPIAQLGECRTLDRKVAGLILTRGVVLCLRAGHFIAKLLSTG